jgi:hypothetical protein
MDIHQLIAAAGGIGPLASRLRMNYQRVAKWRQRNAIPPLVQRAYKTEMRRILANPATTDAP